MGPVYCAPFLGAGATWLRSLDDRLVPPCSWMGGKRRDAHLHLELLGLRASRPAGCVLGDASWWGWVWPVCPDPETGPAVSAVLRSWRAEDPRELWFRLRDAGPLETVEEQAAQLLWLQARAASGVPVWWEGEDAVKWDRTRRGNRGPANQAHAAETALVQDRGWKGGATPTRSLWAATQGNATESKLVQWASTQIDEAGQTRTRDACAKGFIGGQLVAGARADRPQTSYIAGHKGRDSRDSGGIVDPGTVADRLDAIRAAAVGVPIAIAHADALDTVNEWAPRLAARGRWLLDPPYEGCTGYPAECPRDKVLAIAETCARDGARVVLCEAVPLAEDLGAGWSSLRLRDAKKPEWVTTYGCGARALMGPLFNRPAAGAAT